MQKLFRPDYVISLDRAPSNSAGLWVDFGVVATFDILGSHDAQY